MKTTTAAVALSLAFSANAQLTYNTNSTSVKCPAATGVFCAGKEGLIVHCTAGVGAITLCDAGATCYQPSADGGAYCSVSAPAQPAYAGPWVVGGDWKSGECGKPSSSSSTWAWPKPSSTPVSPVIPSSTPCTTTSSTTPVAPVIPSSTPHANSTTPVAPVIPSSTWAWPKPPVYSTPVAPVIPTTPVAPVIPSSTPCATSTGAVRYSTGASWGPSPSSKVTTLNSSWKPMPTPSTTTTTTPAGSSSTTAGPVFATGAASSGKSVNALLFGLVGVVVAFV